MKRKWGYLLVGLFVLSGWLMLGFESRQERIVVPDGEELIRLHILANSDSPEDQQVKLKVRDAVIAYLAPLLNMAGSKNEARQIVAAHRDEIVNTAQEVLRQNNLGYSANMEIGIFDFPIKSYGTIIVPAGKYDAVRILLGNAQGHNWWCVLFPPLCLVDATGSMAVDAGLTGTDSNQQQPERIELKWKLAELWQERQSSSANCQSDSSVNQ